MTLATSSVIKSAMSAAAAPSVPIVSATQLVRSHRRGNQMVESLREVTLSVYRGEFLVITGPSGSGKSTLLHLIGLLDIPTSGQIVLDGIDVSRLSDRERAIMRRDHLGFVFQSFNLLPTLTARDNVCVPLLLAGSSRKSACQASSEALTRVGLLDRADHLPGELSGGEMQRVAIARALINNPDLILCDEPTGNLDSDRGLEILRLLRQLADYSARTIVMATHDPRSAEFGDRIIRLRDGKIDSEFQAKGRNADPVSAA